MTDLDALRRLTHEMTAAGREIEATARTVQTATGPETTQPTYLTAFLAFLAEADTQACCITDASDNDRYYRRRDAALAALGPVFGVSFVTDDHVAGAQAVLDPGTPQPAASLMAAIKRLRAAARAAEIQVTRYPNGGTGGLIAPVAALQPGDTDGTEAHRLLALTLETVERYAEVCRNCPTGPLPADGHRVWTQRIDATRAELVALLGVDDDA